MATSGAKTTDKHIFVLIMTVVKLENRDVTSTEKEWKVKMYIFTEVEFETDIRLFFRHSWNF